MKKILSAIVAAASVLGLVGGDRRRCAEEGAQRRRADAFPDPEADAGGLVLRRSVRHLRQGAAAARPEGLQGSLLGLPFDELVAFRTLEELGYSEAQVKAFAAEYTVQDGPNAEGEMFDRPGIPSDYFPSPFPNVQAAAAANNGAAPPDFSLIAKARGVERGFPTFVFDIFTQYAEKRAGLHPLAADRLRRGAAGRHGDRRGHLLQSLFHRRQVAGDAAAAVGRPGDLRRRLAADGRPVFAAMSPPS